MLEADLVGSMEADNVDFLRTILPRGLLHHSQVLVSIYALALGRMLSMNTKSGAGEILGREEVGLIDLLRSMCLSRFSHVQLTGKKLLEMTLRTSSHVQMIRNYYRGDPSLVVTDLFTTLYTPLIFMFMLKVCVHVTRLTGLE